MGPYNNDTGAYLENPSWEHGQWLAHEDGRLYIIPSNGDSIEGPDDELCDFILQAVGGADSLSETDAETLGLSIVPDVLKRWNAETGYYTA